MAEPIFSPIVRFVLTIMVAIPLWLVMFWLYSKCIDVMNLNPRVSLAASLLGFLLCWEAARSISARAVRREAP
jgi:hypothetical protein